MHKQNFNEKLPPPQTPSKKNENPFWDALNAALTTQ